MNIGSEIGRKGAGNKVKNTHGILKLTTVINALPMGDCWLACGWEAPPRPHWGAPGRRSQPPDHKFCPSTVYRVGMSHP